MSLNEFPDERFTLPTERCSRCGGEWDEESLGENGLCPFCRVGSGQERFAPESNIDIEKEEEA